jgi:hypothetical protein
MDLAFFPIKISDNPLGKVHDKVAVRVVIRHAKGCFYRRSIGWLGM